MQSIINFDSLGINYEHFMSQGVFTYKALLLFLAG